MSYREGKNLVLNVLSALRWVQIEESHSGHRKLEDCEPRPDKEKVSSRLKREEIRVLFHNEFVEMERDPPKSPL